MYVHQNLCDTNGMMPNVAPHAASVKQEKRIMTMMAPPKFPTNPSAMQNTPPMV